MRYLLAVPRIVNNVGDWYWFPTGIGYISSSLKRAGFDLRVLNLNNIEGTVYDIIKHHIDKYDVDALLTGGLTGQYGALREIAESAKKIKKSIITIVGGGIITSAPEHAMQALEYADYGVIGEGEIICRQLCAALEKGAKIYDIPGIVYKDHEKYTLTDGKAPRIDLDKLPLPDYINLGLDKLLRRRIFVPDCFTISVPGWA